MHRILALSLVVASPAAAQIEFSRGPVPGGAETCGDFMAIPDYGGRLGALTGVEPVGGQLPGADPDLARQWADEVYAACEGHPDRPLAEAATEALGGN